MATKKRFDSGKSVWSVRVSPLARDTINPIRMVVESMNLQPNPEKPMIPLSIGDPTVFSNLQPCEEIIDSMIESLKSYKYNGYFPAAGCEDARRAVAEYCSSLEAPLDWTDVILANGCSHALDMGMSVLATPGSNMLAPRPGFPLYKTLATKIGVEIRYYNLLPEKNWQIDLKDLEAQLDSNTAAIIYNNPSNPCGSVYSKEHIQDILDIAERNYVPIISDEIYMDLVFSNDKFYPIASLSTQVPVLTCGGIGKKFLIPGWRLGWVLINDRKARFGHEIRNGLNALAQRLVGPNSIVQGALRKILNQTPKSFFKETKEKIRVNAEIAFKTFDRITGLKPIMPSGAMYLMVKVELKYFPEFESDLDFVERLVSEQSVFCLPGVCFEYPGYFRVVLTVPEELLNEALTRIEEFCKSHCVYVNGINGDNGDNDTPNHDESHNIHKCFQQK